MDAASEEAAGRVFVCRGICGKRKIARSIRSIGRGEGNGNCRAGTARSRIRSRWGGLDAHSIAHPTDASGGINAKFFIPAVNWGADWMWHWRHNAASARSGKVATNSASKLAFNFATGDDFSGAILFNRNMAWFCDRAGNRRRRSLLAASFEAGGVILAGEIEQ
jgi:hypothetical protein